MLRTRDRRLAVGLAALAVLALAGCSTGSARPSASPTVGTEWATTTAAAKSGVASATWALPYGEPSTLHWLRAAAFSENTVLSSLCEGLLKQTPGLGFAPALATSWDTPDDRTYVYHLRRGVRFTDGKAMTADDVVYSLQQNTDPDSGSFWSAWFTDVESITATDASTVTVRLKQPDVLFNAIISTAAGTVVEKAYASSHKDYGTAAGGVMCTGPYELTSWTAGSDIVLTANPDYWDTAAAPKVQRLTFRFVTDATTLANGLRSGALDGAYDMSPTTVAALAGSKEGTTTLGRSTGFVSIETTTKDGPAQDPRVRRALSLSLDRSAIASSIFGGAAQPITSPYFPATWSYAAAVYRSGYATMAGAKPDLAEAKRLVAAAGATDAIRLLTNADDPSAQQLAAYVQTQAQAIGLKVTLASLPASQFIAASFDPKQQSQYDAVLSMTAYFDVPDPLYWGVTALAKAAPFNSSGYDDHDVQTWIERARRTADPAARAALMVQVERKAYGVDQVSIPIVNTAGTVFMNRRLTGAPATFNAHLYGPWSTTLGGAAG